MKSRNYFIAVALGLISCFSCNKAERIVSGTWTIDKIIINDIDIKSNLSANGIKFGSDKYCELPLIDWKGSKKAEWEIKKEDDNLYLIITSQDNMLAGKYLLSFFEDAKTHLQRMVMISPRKELICSKFPGS